MPLLARGFDDLLLDNLVTILGAYSTAQLVFDSTVGFKTERDRMTAPNDDELAVGPVVNIYVSALNPSNRTASRDQESATVAINFDLYAARLEDPSAQGGDKKAMARLYYLKEQIKSAIFAKSVYDLGFAPGIVAAKRWGRFSLSPQPEGAELWECSGSWSFEVDYAYDPTDIPLNQLTTVSVTADKSNGGPTAPYKTAWAGLYTVHA